MNRADRIALTGNLHPKARAEFDHGRIAPSTEISYVTLALAQSDAQKADLDRLLADQQNPSSLEYHRWLTPEQYADRFGVAQADIDKITNWLQSEGLTVAAVARGRNWIAVNGTAAQLESAFRTELHEFLVDGQTHFANTTEPSIPTALSVVIRSIRGLNDFRARPASRAVNPLFTSTSGRHYLSPNDQAMIYNINSLYGAGYDGAGQSLVIAGQTQIDVTDIQTFRSRFNLPAKDPQITLIPGSRDPGTQQGDLGEADLDIEWSGAVARNANILYVYAFNVMDAVQYAIDQNLAPVVSTSYGLCELETPASDAMTMQSWARQGNAQGITWFSASGDSGGADCNSSRNPGLAVDIPGSIPEVTSVGGTEFSEGTGTYWNASTDASGASVISYIPEIAWNDSIADGDPAATGGGASVYFTKPSWQVGAGVPADNTRHVPDISMAASADHDGYLVYTGGTLGVYGGTSVPTPVYAGLAAILNQYVVAKGQQSAAGLGNINPHLYALAQTSPSIFHDISGGDNIVTVACGRRQLNCNNQPVGFSAAPGYDQVTGLGSVDAFLLVTGWNSVNPSPKSDTVLSLLSNLHSIGTNDTAYLTATVTGSATPTGTVIFSIAGVQLGSAPLVGSAGTATATLAVKGSQLAGPGTITATYNDASASVTVSIASSSSNAAPAITALTNAASYQQAFAPGGIMTIWGSQLSTGTQQSGVIPLPLSASGVEVLVNGIAAPLYYVSPTLLNVQIPYDVTPGSATVTVNNNGQIATRTFNVASAGPGIFTDSNGTIVPFPTAARGAQIALFITGAGAVSPGVSTGAAPGSTAISNLPKPSQNVTVTVGNASATVNFVGITPGLVGVVQINFTIPAGVNPGVQPVVVKVGSTSSAAANVSITN